MLKFKVMSIDQKYLFVMIMAIEKGLGRNLQKKKDHENCIKHGGLLQEIIKTTPYRTF